MPMSSASHTSNDAIEAIRTAMAEAVIKGDTAIGKTPTGIFHWTHPNSARPDMRISKETMEAFLKYLEDHPIVDSDTDDDDDLELPPVD